MSKVKVFLAVLALAICLTLPSMAMADMASIGDVFLGNSWGQRFQEDGWYGGTHYNFDKLEVFITSAGTFEAPGMRNFGNSGDALIDASWSGTTVNPKYTIATGASTTPYIQWDYIFNDPRAPIVLDYFAYSGATLLGATNMLYNGSAWSFTGSVLHPDGVGYDRSSPVPLPPSVFLLGSGIIGLGLLGRWRKTSSVKTA